ncbi:chemotaxis protein CheX [Nocardioides yefusunii]|uniref:Chemotaxis protein CheX n=1 Tax=Nocardioides yefusunii TaxID=2500546 RepID=A0ABW1QY08_9ACTN|nr:chemotaxis protein CheX [Nocardioides yefusunii]
MSDTTTPTGPAASDVQAVTEEVWSTFLGHTAPLEPADPSVVTFSPEWSASVTVKGEWNGMVSIDLTDAGGSGVTRGMLGMEESDELTEADVVDAVGELVNMVGGNVKSLVPGPSQLSLPLVATGHFAHGTDEQELVRLAFTWGTEPIAVTVHSGRAAVNKGDR